MSKSSINKSRPFTWRDRLPAIILIPALALVALGICPGIVHAQSSPEIELQLTLDRSEIELGRQASLKLTVSGPSGFSEPTVPEVDGLNIIARGRTQSVQIINMNVKSLKVFGYAVEPQRAGDFTIGPMYIKRGDKVYESNTVNLKVLESDQVPESAPQTSRDAVVEASVDNSTPYVGQQVTLKFRFARKTDARIGNANYQLPDLDDFWKEGKDSKREYNRVINGTEYLVTEVAIPLFPIKVGKAVIGRIMLNYDEFVPRERSSFPEDPFGGSAFDTDFFDRFFGTERAVKRQIFTTPIELDVSPLPAKGKPADFKGGVGKFKLETSLSDDEVKEGKSVTLTVVLSGEGNIRDVADPSFEMKGVKTYPDTPQVSVKSYNDKVVGEKTFKVALVPQEDHELTIPKLSTSYFNPDTKRYETASSAPLVLTVLPSAEEELRFVTPSEAHRTRTGTNVGRQDILPIHERIGSIRSDRAEIAWAKLRPMVYPLPVLLYALCCAIVRRRKRLQTDIEYRRQRFAAKTATIHIDAAAKAIKQKDWDEVFTRCARSVTEYLADKLNVPVGGMTSSDVGGILAEKRVDREFAAEIVKFLEGCDYGRFASPAESPEAAAKCIEGAQRILQRLKREETIK